ncbi:hypothetical protein IWW57_004912, partial [Coemansia sp. S610]
MKHNFAENKRWHEDWVRSGKNTHHLPPSASSNTYSFRPVTTDLLDLRIPLDKILCPLKPQASRIVAARGANDTQPGNLHGSSLSCEPNHSSSGLRTRHTPAAGTSDFFGSATVGHSVADDDDDGDDFQVDTRATSRARHSQTPRTGSLPLAIEIPDDSFDVYDLSDLEGSPGVGENSVVVEAPSEASFNSGSAIDLCSDLDEDLDCSVDFSCADTSTASPKRSGCMRGQSPAQKRARVTRSNPPHAMPASQDSPNTSVTGFYHDDVESYNGAIDSDHDDLLLIEDDVAFVSPQK